MSNNIRMLFIETYLRDGANSADYQALKNKLYQQGMSRSEVIELHVEASLYGSLENFYRKQS